MKVEELSNRIHESNVSGTYFVDFSADGDWFDEIDEIEVLLEKNNYNYKWKYSFDFLNDKMDLIQDISEQGFALIEIEEK